VAYVKIMFYFGVFNSFGLYLSKVFCPILQVIDFAKGHFFIDVTKRDGHEILIVKYFNYVLRV